MTSSPRSGWSDGGTHRTLPPLLRVYAFTLLTVSFLGLWLWLGLNALVLALLGLDPKNHSHQVPLFVGLTVCWVLLLPATLLWHAPELLKRPLGEPPKDANGYAGYLLRHAPEGVLGGPLELGGGAPPVHFWLVAVLFTLISGAADREAFSVVDNPVWKALVWFGLLASVLSVAVLVHGAVTRRRSTRKK
ncbi:hypothetical protein [Streptomyces sp. NPDC050564]|uniref:hypothetical protein n=1 Tax=Streptomyces sp. NPDC050564 TaxID=3365631 RepID=UPI0037A33140